MADFWNRSILLPKKKTNKNKIRHGFLLLNLRRASDMAINRKQKYYFWLNEWGRMKMTKHTNPTIFYGRMAKKKNDRMKWRKTALICIQWVEWKKTKRKIAQNPKPIRGDRSFWNVWALRTCTHNILLCEILSGKGKIVDSHAYEVSTKCARSYTRTLQCITYI